MDFNSNYSTIQTNGQDSQTHPNGGNSLMNTNNPSIMPVTATAIPHFTINGIPTADVNHDFFYDPNEPRTREVGRVPFQMNYYHGNGVRIDQPNQQMPLSYPNQYPSNFLMNQGHYMMPHVPYAMGIFQAGLGNYPGVSSSVPNMIPSGLPSNTANPKSLQIIYRNLFHTLHCKIQSDSAEWEGCRVYISENVGYSGNAKRFKKKAEKGEKALVLECFILTSNDQRASQCLSCKDYFETQKYYKANPECIGRIVLVKNNSPIRIESGQFKILIKMMCCCVHHTVDFFTFQLNLLDGDVDLKTPRIVFSAKIPLNVKQWRKSNQKKDECLMILEPFETKT